MNIVLVGYRGTGKTAVGKILARRLGKGYVGMDADIVRRAGMTIPQIVEAKGWPGFRDLESEVAAELAGQDGLVIDTGGGVIERADNVKALRVNALVFWLKASVAVIVKRIEKDTQRPALVEGKTFTEEVAEVLERREPLYRSAAHHEIDTDTLTPEEVADRVMKLAGAAESGQGAS